jgi:hypothetical protein
VSFITDVHKQLRGCYAKGFRESAGGIADSRLLLLLLLLLLLPPILLSSTPLSV